MTGGKLPPELEPYMVAARAASWKDLPPTCANVEQILEGMRDEIHDTMRKQGLPESVIGDIMEDLHRISQGAELRIKNEITYPFRKALVEQHAQRIRDAKK